MKTKRPTAAQLDVLRKMRGGYRLVEWYSSIQNRRRCKLHPKWGRSIPVSLVTFDILLGAGLIEKVPELCDDYRLTDAGLAALSGDKPIPSPPNGETGQ